MTWRAAQYNLLARRGNYSTFVVQRRWPSMGFSARVIRYEEAGYLPQTGSLGIFIALETLMTGKDCTYRGRVGVYL